MARDLTSGVITQINSRLLRPFVLVKMLYDSGDLNVWNGIGDLTWSGDTYLGAGELGSISEVKETLELEATGLKFSISGVPSAHISTALSEDYQNRFAKLWLGFFNSSGVIIANPFQIFKGRMDVMEIEEAGTVSIISIACENMLVILKKASERRYTGVDQKTEYPNDKGLDFTAILNDGREVLWGG